MFNPLARLARRRGVVIPPSGEDLVISSDQLGPAITGVKLVGYATGPEHRKEGYARGCPRGTVEVALVTPLGSTYILFTFPYKPDRAQEEMARIIKEVNVNGLATVVTHIGSRKHDQFPWVLQQIQREYQLFRTGFIPGDTVKIISTPEGACTCMEEHHQALQGELAKVTEVDLPDEKLPLHVHPLDWDIPHAWLGVNNAVLHNGADDPARKPGSTFVYDWVAKRWKLLFSQEEMDKKEGEFIGQSS